MSYKILLYGKETTEPVKEENKTQSSKTMIWAIIFLVILFLIIYLVK